MNITLLRTLGPAAGLLLVSCSGLNPWSSTPPRREQPSTEPRYNSDANGNPYLQGADHPATTTTTTTTTTTKATSTTPATTDAPPTPEPPAKVKTEETVQTTTTNPPTEAAPPSAPAPASSSLPFGTPVPGKKGFVFSPYDKSAGMIDVRDIPPGTKVRDPYTQKLFLVP